MARNRKSQSGPVRFGPVLKAGVICTVIVTCCVGYVWQKQQINLLGKQVGQRETRLAELREQNERLNYQRSRLAQPEYLESRIKELNLGLGLPKQNQIWRPVEPAAGPATPASASPNANAPRQYAAERTRTPVTPQ
jgi:hypothetical protein